MSDQRKSEVKEFGYRVPRFSVDFQLLLQTTETPARVLEARCHDIGEDGLAAKLPESLSAGTRVTLMLSLPGKSTCLRVPAVVSHQDQGEHGFAFQFTSQHDREFVQKWLSSLHAGKLALARSPKP